MFRIPDVPAVQAVAADLGVTLTEADAAVYTDYLAGQLAEFDEFEIGRAHV